MEEFTLEANGSTWHLSPTGKSSLRKKTAVRGILAQHGRVHVGGKLQYCVHRDYSWPVLKALTVGEETAIQNIFPCMKELTLHSNCTAVHLILNAVRRILTPGQRVHSSGRKPHERVHLKSKLLNIYQVSRSSIREFTLEACKLQYRATTMEFTFERSITVT